MGMGKQHNGDVRGATAVRRYSQRHKSCALLTHLTKFILFGWSKYFDQTVFKAQMVEIFR